jgi:Lrp/AsnC family leucine-responsive transcriptional regulator
MKELASRVNLCSTPVFVRLKRLESNGYIKKYIAVLDAEKLNRCIIVFCNVKMSRLSRNIEHDFAEIIRNIPEVTECYIISGNFGYLSRYMLRI